MPKISEVKMKDLIKFAVLFYSSISISQTNVERLEGAIFVPESYINSYVNKKLQDWSKTFETIQHRFAVQSTFEYEGIQITIPEVLINMHPSVSFKWQSSSQIGAAAELKMISYDNTLLIPPLVVDQIISKQIGSSHLNIRVRFQCEPIVLTQKTIFGESQLDLNHEGSIYDLQSLTLKNMNFRWENPWQIAKITCHGVDGVSEKIKDQFVSFLTSDKSSLYLSLQNNLNAKIQLELKKNLRQIIFNLPGRLSEKISIDSTAFKVSGEYIFGGPGVVFAVKEASDTDVLLIEESSLEIFNFLKNVLYEKESSKDSKLELILQTSKLEKFLQKKLNTLVWNQDLSTINSFSRIIKSRFLQFFIWPDLFNYSKKSSFPTTLTVNFQNLKLTREGLSGNALLKSVTKAYRKNKWQNYIETEAEFLLNSHYTLDQEVLRYSLKSKMKNWNSQMSREYVRRYKPSPYFPESQIKSFIKNRISNYNLNIKIPGFEFENEVYRILMLDVNPQHTYFKFTNRKTE